MNHSALVLDTSALLALLHREPGHDRVQQLLIECDPVMSAVNAAETLAKHEDIGIPVAKTLSLFSLLGIRIVPFELDDAESAGSLRTITRPYGLSLGDNACLALANKLGCPVATADRSWDSLKTMLKLDIRQIRE